MRYRRPEAFSLCFSAASRLRPLEEVELFHRRPALADLDLLRYHRLDLDHRLDRRPRLRLHHPLESIPDLYVLGG